MKKKPITKAPPPERPHSPDGNPEKFRCVICEKDLETCDMAVYGTGYITITFHYGSKFDQMVGFSGPRATDHNCPDDLAKLLRCDKIEAHICDECFEKKYKFFTGFNQVTKEEAVI